MKRLAALLKKIAREHEAEKATGRLSPAVTRDMERARRLLSRSRKGAPFTR